MTPDIALKVTIRNARVMRAMRAAGINNLRELARRVPDASYGVIQAITSFRYRPVNQLGEWTPAAMGMATALHVDPSDLWPNHLREIESKSNSVAFDMTLDEFASVASSHDRLAEIDQVRSRMATLAPRERLVIEMRYGLNGNGAHTLEEIGTELGICKERVRQFELLAFRKMRSPAGRWTKSARHGGVEAQASAGRGAEQ
jgi:DNA-directed RNA polymerase specialized sigma24 family protein